MKLTPDTSGRLCRSRLDGSPLEIRQLPPARLEQQPDLFRHERRLHVSQRDDLFPVVDCALARQFIARSSEEQNQGPDTHHRSRGRRGADLASPVRRTRPKDAVSRAAVPLSRCTPSLPKMTATSRCTPAPACGTAAQSFPPTATQPDRAQSRASLEGVVLIAACSTWLFVVVASMAAGRLEKIASSLDLRVHVQINLSHFWSTSLISPHQLQQPSTGRTVDVLF